jgi:hypothetical protein
MPFVDPEDAPFDISDDIRVHHEEYQTIHGFNLGVFGY